MIINNKIKGEWGSVMVTVLDSDKNKLRMSSNISLFVCFFSWKVFIFFFGKSLTFHFKLIFLYIYIKNKKYLINFYIKNILKNNDIIKHNVIYSKTILLIFVGN